MIFPELGPQYYNQSPDAMSILARMQTVYAEAITINQWFWQEADTNHRFESGDQTIINEMYGNLPANRRRQFSFNRIRPVVNMISGHQRRTRKSIIVVPVENGDSQTADQLTKVIMWVNNQENVLETISSAFQGSLISGMNLLQVWMDYRSDPVSGNIRVDNCSYNTFLIDPFFRKADLSDCNYVWKRSFLTKREVISLMPDKADIILGLQGNDNDSGRDGKFQFTPESYGYSTKNLLTYDEFYYRDYRTQKMLVDTETGESTEWRSTDDEKLKEFLRTYPSITVVNQEIPTCNLAIVVQNKVLYDGPNPSGIDRYPFVPVFCYYRPEMPYFNWRITGVVTGLRDPQYLYNRRKAIELDILESQINSGFIYKENALVNPKDVFLSGQGRGLALKAEAQMTDVQQIQSPQVPPTTIQLSQILAQEINAISGVNEELMGSAMDDKAGILSMLRQGAGLTTLQPLFDQLDVSQKLLGKVMLDMIQANFTPGKVKKILETEEPTPQFYSKAFGRYDAVVEDGFNTSTQKQMEFAQLMQLREIGIPVPDESLIESATLQHKKQLVETIQKNQQAAQQAQQQQMRSQMQLQQAQAELAQARSIADRGLGLERASRVQENQALAIERKAAAEKDHDLALLNLIKALKEIDGIDIAHVEQLLNLSNLMKVNEQQERQSEEDNERAKAEREKLLQQPQQSAAAPQAQQMRAPA